MDQPQATRILTIGIAEGLHMRAAMEVAKLLANYQATVALIKGDHRVDGNDVIQILTLGAEQHEQLTVEAVGAQAEEALDALATLFESDFSKETDTEKAE